jgi:hypothetical protein
MLVDIECQVKDGLRPQEATVMIKDYHGEKHFMPLDRGLLEAEGGKHYVSVFLTQIDPRSKAALVSLPIEADSGAHQIWVRLKDIKDLPEGVSA